jgi:hypothetical protein
VLRSEGGCYEDEDDEDYVEKKKILKICYVLAIHSVIISYIK